MSNNDVQKAAQLALDEGGQSGGGVDGVEGVPGSDGGAMPDSGASVIDGLLETRPASTTSDYPDMPNWAANGLIGTVKFINGISGDRDMPGGKPAVVNWTEALIGFYTGGDESAESVEGDPSGTLGDDFEGVQG